MIPIAACFALCSRPAASQTTPAERVAAAQAQIRAHNLDSAAALLRQVADSVSTSADRAKAFTWLGIVSFYQGDDSATARNFRAALALDPSTDAANLAGMDSTLAAAWRREQAAVRREGDTLTASGPQRGTVPGDHTSLGSPADPLVVDCRGGCKQGERPPRLLQLPQMHIDSPGQLGPSGVHGRVIVQAVIDENGRLEPETIYVVNSSASGFERAVRDVLPMLRFRPAAVGGQIVAARIELRFDIRPEGLDWLRYSVVTP
jgi:hypothetical protein